MQHVTPRSIRKHIRRLQAHLARENPILLEVVKSFRTLDGVAYRLGLLDRNESLTTRVPWWPMIAVLGTFSSGKSTFINSLLGEKLQLTGNQAVDDRFTVIVYAGGGEAHTLPGRALDADPRFPFFQMSRQIEQVHEGEGSRIDAYLQLKTTASPRLKGKIIIDSPGFDADEQRNATLRITDHIIDLSDLVLVFFDARHPEPGAMQDTLEHLVSRTIHRPDSSKFLFVLNQIDNAARENNPEEVFGAWQRALANKGLTAGRFYAIYDLEAAVPIEDPKLRERFETKRSQDQAAIEERLDQVEVERAYRIIGVLEHTAQTIQKRVIPRLRSARESWKRRVLWLDGIVFSLLAVGAVAWAVASDHWQGLSFDHPLVTAMTETPLGWGLFLGGIALVAFSIHVWLRQVAAQTVLAGLEREDELGDVRDWVVRAFRRNASAWRPLAGRDPVGLGRSVRRRLARVLNDADGFVQSLNNRFADPSGGRTPRRPAATAEPQAPVPTAPADVSVVKPLPTGTRRS
jgi:GTPase SAR1 family protein